jgi:hypothetical protein
MERKVGRMELEDMVLVEVEDKAHMVGHMEVALEHTDEVLDMAMEDMIGHKVDMAGIDCSCRSSRVRMKKHLE